MPTITIDGEQYEVAEGRTVLQAIDDLGLLMNGVDMPHYCWHPKLSIDGSCRMCQVEIDDIPKLQIACNTPVRDGMEVRTRGERVEQAQRGVMELLLINHPLDCPICDQAGECKLQDYAYEYGVKHARTREPRRPAKKGVELGPTITFDQERCILCRRCVRFCREIPETGELGVFNRGDRSLLEVFPGSQLDNDYSMNVADICPVGALTTTDFRFKTRVWFLDDVESLCNGCSNGCNVYASRSQNRVYRFVPRRNDAVNDTWMCDAGRMSYQRIATDRLAQSRLDGRDARYTDAVRGAATALSEVRERGGSIACVASPHAANEDLFVLRELASALGAPTPVFAVERGDADALLVKAEKAANAEGCRALGFGESDAPLTCDVAIVLGHDVPASALSGVGRVILIDTHDSALVRDAYVVLPAAYFAEKTGTFTNHARRVQGFLRVVDPPFEAWAEGDVLWQIGCALGLDGFEGRYDVRGTSKHLAESVPAFNGLDLDSLDEHGAELA